MSKSIDEILEVFDYNGEYEFSYNGDFYHFEPSDDGYVIWKFSNCSAEQVYNEKVNGERIASAKSGKEALEIKCFDGKSYLEIDDEVEDGLLR